MADLGDIGSAHVTVELDFQNALRELQQRRDNMGVRVELDQSQVTRELESTLDRASAAAGDAEARVDFDDRQAARALRDTLNKASKDSERDVDRSFTRLGGRGAGGFFGGFFNRLKGLNFGGRLVALIKPVALIAALGVVAQALSVATAGVVALVGALLPLSGALVAMPAILGSVYQSLLVVKLAMQGVSEALGGLTDEIDKEAFAKLSPPAQKFVKVLDALKPGVIELQKALQNAAFPGFTAGLKSVSPLLKTLRPGLVDTATIMGDLAENLGRVAASMRGDLSNIIALNNTTIRNLGLAGIEISKALVDTLIAARPLINFMTGSLLLFSQRLSGLAGSARGAQALNSFFADTRKTIILVNRLVGELGGILGSIFGASLPLGRSLLRILIRNADEFGKFLKTADGQKGLENFFRNAGPAILELGGLIGDVTKEFFKLSQGDGLRDILRDVRKLVPQIGALVKVTTEDFLPVLIPALGNIAELFILLSGTSGPLNLVVRAVGGIAAGLVKILNTFPLLLPVIFGLGVFAGLGGSFLVLTKVFGLLVSAVNGLIFIFGAFQAVLAAVGITISAVPVAIGLAVAAVVILAIKFSFVRKVLLAVGAVVLALVAPFVALGVALVVLWQRSQTFRDIVKGAMAAVSDAFNAAKAKFGEWWVALQTALDNARTRISALPGEIKGWFQGIDLTEIGAQIIRTLLDGMSGGAYSELQTFVKSIGKWIKDNKGPLSADKKLLFDEGSAIMGGFHKGLMNKWSPIEKWVGSIGGFFKGAVPASSLDFAGALMGTASIGDLTKQLKNALGVPAGVDIGGGIGGLGGFLHPTSGLSDTLSQGHLLEKMFGVGITSGLRPGAITSSGNTSQHALGEALDFGTSRGSFGALTNLAAFSSRLNAVFKQVIWLDKIWANGGPTNIPVGGHMDHVHLGWQRRRAAGGGVRKGQAYQWNERGAEMFMPGQNGYVMNAGRTKELVSAIKSLAQRPANASNNNAQIHVHSNAVDPVAVGSIVMSNLGGVFSRA